MKKKCFQLYTPLLLLLFAQVLPAQDLIWTPRNPAFGGNTLNYSWMLNSANSQNEFTSRGDDSGFSQQDELQSFTESLNRQILSQISRQVFDAQFGEEGIQEGSYQFGDFQIDVVPSINGLLITIFDFSTGAQTQITVPAF